MSNLAPYAKAVTAAVVAGLTGIATALDDGTITAQEGVYAAIAFLVALGAVWAVPNAATKAKEDGQADVGLILLILTFVGVVLLLFGVSFR